MPYFAPSYFAPSYFGGWGGGHLAPIDHPGDATSNPTVRDSDIYADVIRRLVATKQFSAVEFGEAPEGWSVGTQKKSLAVVIPGSADESGGYDNTAGNEVLRRVTWTLEIRVRDPDFAARFDRHDRLCHVARKAINGRSLAGATYADTRLGSDQPGRSATPERVGTLKGTFTYSIDDPTGRDVAFHS